MLIIFLMVISLDRSIFFNIFISTILNLNGSFNIVSKK